MKLNKSNLIPFFPTSETSKNSWINKLLSTVIFYATFLGIGWAVYSGFTLSTQINLKIFAILVGTLLVLVTSNILTLACRYVTIFIGHLQSTPVKILPVNSKYLIIFLSEISLLLGMWIYGLYTFNAIVSDTEGYANYFEYQNSEVTITGDWKDSSILAKEFRNQEINCKKTSKECVWTTASIQKWNNNYLSVDSTTFPIVSWDENIIKAALESDNRTEEIMIFRKNCKMIYIKSPKKGVEGFSPDNLTLTMEASYCK